MTSEYKLTKDYTSIGGTVSVGYAWQGTGHPRIAGVACATRG